MLSIRETAKIPVRTEDEEKVFDASNMDLDTLLQNISFGPDKLRGPSITVLGKTFYLFELNGKVSLSLGKWNIQAKADTEKKTVQMLIGFNAIKSDAAVGGDYSGRGDWTKTYAQVRDLYKSINGNTWDYNDSTARSRFSNLYNRLKDKDQTIFLNIKGSIAGYMEWNYETGSMKFSEGGIIISASSARPESHPCG